MNFIDKTEKVKQYVKPCVQRPLDRIKRLVVHRFGPLENGVQILHAEDAAAFFGANPEYTGGKMAYHFIITDDGEIERALVDTDVGQHTRGYNSESIGVAVLGDFRKKPPTPHQRAALIELLASLMWDYKIPLNGLVGHDECAGGSADPNKKCPGKHLNMKDLREDVAREVSNAR